MGRYLMLWSNNTSLSHQILILMSVLMALTTVTLMLSVPTLPGASPVPVIMDTLGMESLVLVGRFT